MSSLPKFPNAVLFSSGTEIKSVSTKEESILCKPDKNNTSPYDELPSFTYESPGNNLSPIEYITDNQFESCSDSELGTPTPSLREPLSSEMFIATICESANTDLERSSTIRKKHVDENTRQEEINICNTVPTENIALNGENQDQCKETLQHPFDCIKPNEHDCQPASNETSFLNHENIDSANNTEQELHDSKQNFTSNNQSETDNLARTLLSDNQSKVSKVNINLVCSHLHSSFESVIDINSPQNVPSANGFEHENSETESIPLSTEKNCVEKEIKTNVELNENSCTKMEPSNLIKGSTSYENGNGYGPNKITENLNMTATYVKESDNFEKEHEHFVCDIDKEHGSINNNDVLTNSNQIINQPYYKNVQEQIRSYENNQPSFYDDVKSSNLKLNNENNGLNKDSTGSTSPAGSAETVRNVAKSLQSGEVNKFDSQEPLLNLTEIKDNRLPESSAPLPPPRISSKNLIPPPIPPYIEEDEDECKPPVPPFPALLSITTTKNSPSPPQRQYLLIPIDQLCNYRAGQQLFLQVPPSPPQRTTSYKKFVCVTPNHTNHPSPELER